MDKNEFRSFCVAHSLTCVSDIKAAGRVGNYFVTCLWGGKKRLSVLLPTGDGQQKQYSKELKARLKERFGAAVASAWGDGYLAMYLELKKLDDPYSGGLVPALEVLRSVGFTVPDECQVCGRPGCDMTVPKKGAAYAPVHKSCLESTVSQVRDKAELNANKGSYLLGFIGAVLGMLVGIIPSLITIIALQRIYVILFMVIPICVYAGYKLLRGKMNYTALVLSILLSVVGVFAIFYIRLIYELTREGLTLAMTFELLRFFGHKELLLEIVKTEDFIKCALFVAAGIFLAWGRISRTSKNDVHDAEGVLGSAIPLSSDSPAGEYELNTEE